MTQLDRRQFLNRSQKAGLGLAAAGSLLGPASQLKAADSDTASRSGPKVGGFTKSFQDRSIPEVCRIFKEIGLDGLDLTVRPGGHIDPADVEQKLPLAHQAAKQEGVEILFLTTTITDDGENAERVLATAAEIGIDRVKMGYYRYGEFGSLAKRMVEIQRQMAKVIKLAAKYQILPCVHIHSGTTIPSHGTQLYQLIRDFSPEEIGAYVDPLHMTLEGGRDGWRQGLDLLAPWIGLVAVKNFAWESGERDKYGQLQWRTRNVPIADGVSPLPQFVGILKKLGLDAESHDG